jgi:hypothetical protein
MKTPKKDIIIKTDLSFDELLGLTVKTPPQKKRKKKTPKK